MSVILGLVFLTIVAGNGIRRNRRAFAVPEVPLSRIDEKTVILELK